VRGGRHVLLRVLPRRHRRLIFATKADLILLVALFVSLGVFAAIEQKISKRTALIYEGTLFVLTVGYLLLRPLLNLDTFDLRFSQFLAILSLLGIVVYVVDHRRRYPYL